MSDMVNHPTHYTSGKVECIDAIESALTKEEFRGFLKGQILKYTWRERHKGGVEDLKKSEFYSKRLIALDESSQIVGTTVTVGDTTLNIKKFSIDFCAIEPMPSVQSSDDIREGRRVSDEELSQAIESCNDNPDGVGRGFRKSTDADIAREDAQVRPIGTNYSWSPRDLNAIGRPFCNTGEYRVPIFEPSKPVNDDPDGYGPGYRRATVDDCDRSDMEIRGNGHSAWNLRDRCRVGCELIEWNTDYRVPIAPKS